jgi:hypothetical protein
MGSGGQRAYENEMSIGIQLGGYVVCHVVVEEGGACDKKRAVDWFDIGGAT